MSQYFYDGQIRRYIVQVIRLLSNFVVRYSDGTLVRVPVMYGDPDRQAASIVNQNSENILASAPRIAVYISGLDLDRSRLGDSTYVGKMNIRERAVEADQYTSKQGSNYTVERLMPTPFKLTLKADIWTANSEQKLQLLEQILVLFNPSLEIQTTDNYIDWTSLSVVEINDIVFSSRSVPVGTNSAIDIATLALETPIWITPPAKVKKLGVITNIITNILGNIGPAAGDYIEGLGTDPNNGTYSPSNPLISQRTSVGDFDITVAADKITLSSDSKSELHWQIVVDQYPGTYQAGLSRIYLHQTDGSEVVGYFTISPLNSQVLIVNWDEDTFPTNDAIPGPSRLSTAWGSFDAVIDPTKTGPRGSGLANPVIGTRYLILENIGGGIRETFTTTSRIQRIDTDQEFDKIDQCNLFVNGVEVATNTPINLDGIYIIMPSNPIPSGSIVNYVLNLNADGPDAWKNNNGSDFIADANDIIEWDGTTWHVVFSANLSNDELIYQTNSFTLIQYKWNGISWLKSFDGTYLPGEWSIAL